MKKINLAEPLPNGWLLKDYQIEGVSRMVESRRLVLAHDMGLGKTAQALIATLVVREEEQLNIPLYVICPVTLIYNWESEAKKLGVDNIHCFSWARFPNKDSLPPSIILVLDEAHYMKSLEAKRTHCALELALSKCCIACWLLTGTPMSNGLPANLYPLLLAVKADFVYRDGSRESIRHAKNDYEKKYCAPSLIKIPRRNPRTGQVTYRNVQKLGVNQITLPILKKEVAPFVLRKTKDECLSLKGKTRIMQWINLPKNELKEFNEKFKQIMGKYINETQSATPEEAHSVLIMAITALRKLSSFAKVSYICQLVEELRDQGESVVVFTKFKDTANECFTRLSKAHKCELLIGSIPQKERGGKVERFQSGESTVFISTIDTGGVGITLTKARYLILADRDFLPENNLQAEDRCNRLGQENLVFCYWLSVHLIDTAIDSLNTGKLNCVSMVLGDKEIPITDRSKYGLAQTILTELSKLKQFKSLQRGE